MDDELLGYLQGAMQPAEREAFERRLAVDDELRRRCELIRESLREIVAAESPALDRHPAFDPPAGLARRTCEFVAQLRAQEAAIFFSAMSFTTSSAPSKPKTFTLSALPALTRA